MNSYQTALKGQTEAYEAAQAALFGAANGDGQAVCRAGARN